MFSFGGGGAGVNGFGVGVRGGVRGGGGGSLEIIQGIQMSEGSVAAAAAALEAEEGCIPEGEVVGREVVSGEVRRHRRIDLVRRSGGNAVM